MKVAIIGNMNNAGFSIMRYLRDLGVDAHLFTYSTDGQGQLSHFTPEADTWNIEKWQSYIHPLGIPNTTEAVLGRPHKLIWPQKVRRVRQALSGYTHFIGTGVVPALFERTGLVLDIFWPYSIGVEFYNNHEFRARRKSNLVRRLAYARVAKMQAQGIRRCRHVLNAELSATKTSLDEMAKTFHRLALPAVYNGYSCPACETPEHLSSTLARLEESDLALFCCTRQMWLRDPRLSESEWNSVTKNSDWLFRGLASFAENQPNAKPLLAVVEYGPDVEATKSLVAELGIEEYVLWLPKMPRREIMLLLQACDIGVGEFYIDPGVIWGGTGWEVLASGRPLMQSFNFDSGEFEAQFGHEPPKLLDVKSADDVERHLETAYHAPEQLGRMGAAALAWFNSNNGISLAGRWLEYLDRQ